MPLGRKVPARAMKAIQLIVNDNCRPSAPTPCRTMFFGVSPLPGSVYDEPGAATRDNTKATVSVYDWYAHTQGLTPDTGTEQFRLLRKQQRNNRESTGAGMQFGYYVTGSFNASTRSVSIPTSALQDRRCGFMPRERSMVTQTPNSLGHN